ncbi:hypothetical protein BMF94_3883 [Rhodotorula taiwanensis]|uniref:SRP9 domain-containing protein n=1 Tax=Rhodotorula taiwanensis TaxID=741276 RepID=A0A2S5B8G1_9BASI|nr:hypothetical protein BMF94_3883 [Rhodotorula taiwanensis]
MLFRSWDAFTQACVALCDSADTQTRTCIRWRHQVGLLVIKVTDDKQTLTFKTRSSVYLNRFDSLNRQLLRRYANKQRATATSLPLISEQQATATATAGGMQADEPEVADAASAAAGDSGAAAGGAASKKKKSKGKKKANK